MRVELLFSPSADDKLCQPDPRDPAHRRRRHYESIPDDADVLVVWRERGEQFEGGYLDHIFAQGTFENVTADEVELIRNAAAGLIDFDEEP